jgi:hypothetical protein
VYLSGTNFTDQSLAATNSLEIILTLATLAVTEDENLTDG